MEDEMQVTIETYRGLIEQSQHQDDEDVGKLKKENLDLQRVLQREEQAR